MKCPNCDRAYTGPEKFPICPNCGKRFSVEQQSENESLRKQLDSANDKLRRIADGDYFDERTAREIAGSPIGPDWKVMCEEAKPLLLRSNCMREGGPCILGVIAECETCPKYQWIRSYNEVAK